LSCSTGRQNASKVLALKNAWKKCVRERSNFLTTSRSTLMSELLILLNMINNN
jgi:hypothetical protein